MEDSAILAAVQREIDSLFLKKSESEDPITLWEAFKAVIWGILINLASYKKLKRNKERENLIDQIVALENDCNDKTKAEVQTEIDSLKNQLKMIGAHKIAKSIKFSQLTFFDYQDKSGC